MSSIGVQTQGQLAQKDPKLKSRPQPMYRTRDYQKEVSSKKAIVLQSGSPLKTQFGPDNVVLKDAVYMTGEDPLFGPVLAIIYSDPKTKYISTVFISRHGATGYTDMTLSPKSKYYDACRNLLKSHLSSPIRKALAITALRSFATMNSHISRVLCEHALKYSVYNWDETMAGTLASNMKLADKKYPQQVGQAILSSGILEPSVIGTYVIDVIYEDSDTTIEMNNELVYLLGEQLEQLFDPLSEFSPEPTEILYTPPEYPAPIKGSTLYNNNNNNDKSDYSNSGPELINSIITELVQVQHNFQLNLVKFLQQYLIPLRVEVISHRIEGLTISKLNSIFPPTIDEVARINNLFYDALQSASKYGFFEVIKACGMTIPYFYKACMRHEAATKNFSRTLNTYYATIHDYFQPTNNYSIRMIESIVQSSLNLTKIKMILDRLMKEKPTNLTEEENELVDEYYHSARETIDSFGRETTLEPYNRRIFTPTGKILIEIASDWPIELQYGWMNRCVVTIFDGYNILTSNHETAILFTDHVIFLETVEPQSGSQSSFSDKFDRFTTTTTTTTTTANGLTPAEIYARRKGSGRFAPDRLASGRIASVTHKPSIADMLMHSLINKVPVPHIPKLRVIGWASIDELSMSEFNNSHSINVTVRKGCMKKSDKDALVDEVRIYELNPNTHVGGASKIIELLTKSRIMSKTQPFHLFNNRPNDSSNDGFNMYMTVHESQGYQEENQKTPIAIFLNTEVKESFLYEKQLAVCYSLSINKQSANVNDLDNDLVHIESFSVLDYSFNKKVRKGDVSLIMNHEVAKAYTLFFSAVNPNMTESIINSYEIIANWLVKFATERDEAHRKKAETHERKKQETALKSIREQSLIKQKHEQQQRQQRQQQQQQLQSQSEPQVQTQPQTTQQRNDLIAGPRVVKKRSSVANFFRLSSRKSEPSSPPRPITAPSVTATGIAAQMAKKRGSDNGVNNNNRKTNYRNISPAAIYQKLRGRTASGGSSVNSSNQGRGDGAINGNGAATNSGRLVISGPMPIINTDHPSNVILEEDENEDKEKAKSEERINESPLETATIIPPTPLLQVSERYDPENEAMPAKPTILMPTSRSRQLMNSPILEDSDEDSGPQTELVRPRKDFGNIQQYRYRNTNSDYDDSTNSEILKSHIVDINPDSSSGSGSVLKRFISEEYDNYQGSQAGSNVDHRRPSETDFVFDDSLRVQKCDDSGWATIGSSHGDSVNNMFDTSLANLVDNMSDLSLPLLPPSRPTTSDGRFLEDSPFMSGEEGFETSDEDDLTDDDNEINLSGNILYNESGNNDNSVIIHTMANESRRSRNIRNRNSINSQFLSQNFSLHHIQDNGNNQEENSSRSTTSYRNNNTSYNDDDEYDADDNEEGSFDCDDNDDRFDDDDDNDDGLSLSSRSFVSATEDEDEDGDNRQSVIREYSDINIFQFMNQIDPIETADPASIVAASPMRGNSTQPIIPSTPSSRRSAVYNTSSSSASRMMMYRDRDSPQRYRAMTPKSISPRQKPATPSSASVYHRRNSSIYNATPGGGGNHRTSMMMDASFAYLAGLLNGTVDISTLVDSPVSVYGSPKAYRYDQHDPTMKALEENTNNISTSSNYMVPSSSAVLYPTLRDSSIVFLGQYIRSNAFDDVAIKRENSEGIDSNATNSNSNNNNNKQPLEDTEGFNIAQANKRLSIGSFSDRGLTRANSSTKSFRHSFYGVPSNYYNNHIQGSSPSKRLSLYASGGSSQSSSPTKRGSTPLPVNNRAFLQHYQHQRQQSVISTANANNINNNNNNNNKRFSAMSGNEGQWMAQALTPGAGGRQRNSMISWVTKDKNNRDSIISWSGGDAISFTPLHNINDDDNNNNNNKHNDDQDNNQSKDIIVSSSHEASFDPETWDENDLSRGTEGAGEIYTTGQFGTQESFNMSMGDSGTPNDSHNDSHNDSGDITNPDYTNTEEHFNEFANNDDIVDHRSRVEREKDHYNQTRVIASNDNSQQEIISTSLNDVSIGGSVDLNHHQGGGAGAADLLSPNDSPSFIRDLSKVSGMSLNTLQVSTFLSQIDAAIELECSDIMDGRVSDRNANEMVRIRSVVLMLLDRAQGGFSCDMEEEATARCIMLSEVWIVIAMMDNSGPRSDRYKMMLNSMLDIETLRRYFVSENM